MNEDYLHKQIRVKFRFDEDGSIFTIRAAEQVLDIYYGVVERLSKQNYEEMSRIQIKRKTFSNTSTVRALTIYFPLDMVVLSTIWTVFKANNIEFSMEDVALNILTQKLKEDIKGIELIKINCACL